jgi:hypothetical protein
MLTSCAALKRNRPAAADSPCWRAQSTGTGAGCALDEEKVRDEGGRSRRNWNWEGVAGAQENEGGAA